MAGQATMKKDCFAFDVTSNGKNRCAALDDKNFLCADGKKCPFYKPIKKYLEDIEALKKGVEQNV